MLEKAFNIDATLTAFTNALQLFQQNKAAAEIRAALYKSPRFKAALTTGFKEPAPVSVLAKRSSPEKS